MDQRGNIFLLSILSLLMIPIMLTGWVVQAQSQPAYPTRAIDLIVPFPPGGTTDLMARVMADFLKKKWNVPINVMNKPGGSGVPANVEVYSAAPDGYTIMSENQSSCPFLEITIKDLPYKVMDRTFIAGMFSFPSVFVVCPKLPVNNLKELEAEIKRDPGNFTWWNIPGATPEFVQRQLFKAMGVDITKTKPVTARGAGEAYQMIGGCHIKNLSDAAPSALPHVKGGLVKALAITVKMPELYPDLPTTAEQGYPAVDHVWWWGFSGPPRLPSDIVDRWEKTLQEIIRDPEFISKIKGIGGMIQYRNARELRELVSANIEQGKELWGMK